MNTVQLIGRLTRDPELRFTASGSPTTTIRLAVPRRRRNSEDQAPVYVDVLSFGPRAQATADYLSQGRRVAVVGRLEHPEWTAEDGTRRSKHEVIAAQVDFLDAPPRPEEPEPAHGPDEELF